MPVETSLGATASKLLSSLHLKESKLPTTAQAHGVVTPETVLKMTSPAPGYMCPLDANIYGIDFLNFRIKDYDSNKVIFEISRDPDAPAVIPADLSPEMEHMVRCANYNFGRGFLTLKTIRTLLEFRVGDQPLNNFRMIERHFFKGKLMRTYDFTFGFCIPNSCNTWEAIYQVPKLSAKEIQDYVSSESGHESDSFYFVDNKLVMHNKAKYSYTA